MNLLIKWLIYAILISCILSQELNINTLTDIILQHNSILKLSLQGPTEDTNKFQS